MRDKEAEHELKLDGVKARSNKHQPPRRRRWPLIVAVVPLALLAVPVILFLTHWPFTREKITAEIQQTFPGPVEIQRFHRSYFPRPGCAAEGITVRGSSRDLQRPIITARKLIVQGAYRSVLTLSKSIQIRSEGLRAFLPPHYDGRSERQSTGKGTSKTIINDLEIDNAVLEIGREENQPVHFDVHHLKAGPIRADTEMKFSVQLTNPMPRGEVKVDGHLGPWRADKVPDIAISGSYTFVNADLGVFSAIAGAVSSAGKFDGVLGKIAVEGWTRSPNFEIRSSGHPVSVEGRFRAHVNGTNGDVFLRDTSFSWQNTTLLAIGEITSRAHQKGKTVDVDLTVHRGRIQDLMRLVMHSDPTMDGPASFRGKAVLPPGNVKFIERVQFAADFGIDDAQFTRLHAQQGVDKLSERARGDKDNDPERVLSDLKGHVLLRDGVARFTNATFAVPAAVAQFGGKCNMVTKQLDLHGQLRIAATVSQTATGFKSVLLKVVDPFFKNKKRHAGGDVPVKMTGTFAHPQFGIDLLHHPQ